jgi:hypothetical protein
MVKLHCESRVTNIMLLRAVVSLFSSSPRHVERRTNDNGDGDDDEEFIDAGGAPDVEVIQLIDDDEEDAIEDAPAADAAAAYDHENDNDNDNDENDDGFEYYDDLGGYRVSDDEDIEDLPPATQYYEADVGVADFDSGGKLEPTFLERQVENENVAVNAAAVEPPVIDLLDSSSEDIEEAVGEAAREEDAAPMPEEAEDAPTTAREQDAVPVEAAVAQDARETVRVRSVKRSRVEGGAPFPEPISDKKQWNQITAVLDQSLAGDDALGRSVRNIFEATRQKSLDKAVLYAYETLPLRKSITWRYHDATEEPVGGSSCNEERKRRLRAHSARYTVVLLNGEEFVNLMLNDCEELRKLLRAFAASALEYDHQLCLLASGVSEYVTKRERQEFSATRRTDGAQPVFSRDMVDARVAEITVQHPNVVVVTLPMVGVAEHVCVLHNQLARKRFETEASVLDFLADKSQKTGGTMTCPAKERHNRPAPLTSQDIFLKALEKIDGVSTHIARAIVARYGTMRSLMNAYADPRLSEDARSRLLSDMMPVVLRGENVKGSRRIGEVLSARVFEVFRPRNDRGETIVSRGGGASRI